MRSPRTFVLLLLPALLLSTAPAADARELLTRVAPGAGRTAALSVRPRTALLAVDRAALEELRAAEGGTIALPLADGSSLELMLERRELFAPGARVTVTEAGGERALVPDVAVFRGRVPGDERAWAVVTLTPEAVHASVFRDDRRLLLMPATAPVGGAEPPLHALADESALETPAKAWKCGVEGAMEAELERGGELRGRATPNRALLDAPRRVFTIAVDCDSDLVWAKFGGNVTAATAYVTTLLATVSLNYEKDLDVTLNVGYLNFWSTTDPYTQPTTGGQLPEFRSWWNANRQGVPRALAHLLSGRDLGGGIAYLNVLCASVSGGSGYGVSAIDCAYAYPTNAATWDANVVAHELGHNFASWHTHSCNWAAQGYISPATATLDSCQASEGGCHPVSDRLPPDKGTIMSYCHLLTGGVAVNLRMDFHPVCVERMRAAVDAAPCDYAPAVAPPRNVSIATIPSGARVSWQAGGSPGVLGYVVYRSRFQLDPKPAIAGVTGDLSFDDGGLGLWHYKVRAYTASDTSYFGAEVKLDLCTASVAAELPVGTAPAAVVTADFTGDGIADLAVANQTGNTISLLAGNGALGVGDGTFGAAATVVSTPANVQCLIVADAGNDGLPDLVAGAAGDSALWIWPGGGAAGVPDGTFGAGTRVPLGFVPTGVATADFDEDGIPDFVVAGHATGVVLLFGNGTGGVPDGTWAAPALVSFGSPTRAVVVGDFDENGIWDLAVTTTTWLRVLRGQGTGGVGNGTFMTPTQHNASANAYELITGDFNLDGITDLFAVYSTVGGAGMLLGNGSGGVGSGTFPASATSVSVGSNARSPRVGDWNADGIPDVAFVNNNATKTLSILTGKGNGAFNTALTWVMGTNPYAMALGDWNEDGGYDLAIANRGANTVTPFVAGCGSALSLEIALTDPAGADSLIEGVNRTITWTKGAGVTHVDLQVSRDGGVTWTTIARQLSGTSFTWTPTPPATSQGRLRVVDSARDWAGAASAADVAIFPASVLDARPAATRLALLGAWPNPSRGAFSVSLALPAGGRGAKLELLDLAGRRVAEVPLAAYGPGVHTVPLRGEALRPGVYLVRLSGAGAGDVRSRKVAVLE